MPKIVAIIQARMGSARLPGKVMMDVGGKALLGHLIGRLRQVPLIHQVAVATTTDSADAKIVEFCKRAKVNVYQGSESDVLARYIEAGRLFKADVVIRVTGDEPYHDPVIMREFLRAHLNNKEDVEYTCNNFPRTFPYGNTVEIIKFPALERAARMGLQPQDREHVTFYIHQHPAEFKIQNIQAQGKLKRPDIRYCVDTQADLNLIRTVFDHLGKKTPYFTMEQIIDLLDQHDEIRQINRHCQQKRVAYSPEAIKQE
ncbi:MAG: glycosyltransferase family protein [Candidatus Omnitrophica bacterium]|nr:glycosyltransferase family protein [Candidatus Omnitrophota bacterium]